jgi:hypothetical protein
MTPEQRVADFAKDRQYNLVGDIKEELVKLVKAAENSAFAKAAGFAAGFIDRDRPGDTSTEIRDGILDMLEN